MKGDARDPVVASGGDAGADFGERVAYSYLVGVFVATNAIRDAYLLVEGPDCIHMKTQFLQGNHDWMSTLTNVSGHHRVANTALHPDQMTGSREKGVREILNRMAAQDAVPAIMLSSMPMAFITGADYERLCGEVSEGSGKPVIHIPGKSLSGDWLDGYMESLLSLARQLDLSGGSPRPDKVAVVGYLHDRNEGDHRGNAGELKGILRSLDLDPVSIWLDGGDFADLYAIRDAGTILSFPYGRKAAQWVAGRTGARLVECDLPFGLDATLRWVRLLGREFDREGLAEALIERRLPEVVRPLEWVIPYVFQNRRWGYVGDPFLAAGLSEIARTVGSTLSFACITNPPRHAAGLDEALAGDTKVLKWPRRSQMTEFIRDAVEEYKVSVLVTNNSAVGILPESRVATVEFGFPSYFHHQLSSRPFLGFEGFLAFLDRLANGARMQEVAYHRTRTFGP